MEKTFSGQLEKSLQTFWSKKCFSDFKGESYTFEEVSRIIVRSHLSWKAADFEKGFRIAMCGRNCAMWSTSLIASFTYGAVAVPLLNEFTADQVERLVNHSEAKLLIVAESIWKNLNIEHMPSLEAVVLDNSALELVYFKNTKVEEAFKNADNLFAAAYPNGLKPSDLKFYRHQPDELLMINYTSGTTSDPKGVMIPERAIWSNMAFAEEVLPNLNSSMSVLSLLPTAHLYGMSFEVLYEFIVGIDITFIPRSLSPAIILQALKEVKPNLLIVVPMILEKVVRKGLMPKWSNPKVQMLRKCPVIGSIIKKKFRDGLLDVLGGNIYEVIIGGAALSADVEDLLHEIKFPYTVGYGMTECAPILGYSDWKTFAPHSCGRPAPRMEIKIISNDPQNVPGEIIAKGMNVMLGYYKNEEATRRTIDSEGWLHTGDMGVMDKHKNIYIRGRVKNMLLSNSGQNVYPEEIEAEINALKYVAESVVVQRGNRLVALVYPDRELAASEGLENDEQILAHFEKNKSTLNKSFAAYSHIAAFEIVKEEFVKTPKKSIKRFLYS